MLPVSMAVSDGGVSRRGWPEGSSERGGRAGPGCRPRVRRRRSGPPLGPRRSVGARPGLLLDDEVALDGEDTATLAQFEEVDQVRIDVELVAVLAQTGRDPEAQPLGSVRQPEGRVEPGHDELVTAAGTTLTEAG